MLMRPLAALALALAGFPALAQETDGETRAYAVIVRDEAPAAAAPERGVLLVEIGEGRAWTLLGPFATAEDAGEAASAAGPGIEALVADGIAVSEPEPGGGEDDREFAPFYRLSLWRFYEGAEARGTDIVRDRLFPSMSASGEALLLRLGEGAPWDLLALDGPFASPEAAQARIDRKDVHFEDMLIARIGDPRTLAATRAELGALVAEEEQRVARREGLTSSAPP